MGCLWRTPHKLPNGKTKLVIFGKTLKIFIRYNRTNPARLQIHLDMNHMILLFSSLNQCIWSLFINRNGELLMQMCLNAFLTATSSLRACLLNLFSTKTKRISNVILNIISVTILLKVFLSSFAYQTINLSCKILLQGSKQFNSNSLRKKWYSKTLATWTKRRKSTIKYW